MKNILVIVALLHFCSALEVVMGQNEPDCFIPGKCNDGFFIQVVNSVDEYECLSFCKDDDLCEWFTFFDSRQTCLLFQNCTSIDTETCDDCLSGQRDCELPDAKCWISGECEGSIIDSKPTELEAECLRLCKSQINCEWFTFFQSGKICLLFSECVTFDETSLNCISGERRCKEDVESTTIVTSTTPETTTSEQPPAYSKVLVALGVNGPDIDDIEIVDLLSSETTCQKPANFPYPNTRVAGGLGFYDKPIICGGENKNRSACHIYEDGAWKSSDSLNHGRFIFQMVKSPFQDGKSKLFLTGEYMSSSEVLTVNGWQLSVPLPVTIAEHCMVTVNSTSVMVIGGYQNGQRSGRSFLFNSETNIWTEGPTLINARSFHKCEQIRKDSQTQDMGLIAVGGYDYSVLSSVLSSVEVLDFNSNAWRRGPDLPFAIIDTAIVQHPSGGVVLIGGYVYDGDIFLDTIFLLPHAGPDATWKEMPQKLKTLRGEHTAFLIPDEIAACN